MTSPSMGTVDELIGAAVLLSGEAAETPAKNKAVSQPVDTEIRFHSVVRKSKSLPLLRPPERTTFVSEINRLAAQ
jgi:hypothetical protein